MNKSNWRSAIQWQFNTVKSVLCHISQSKVYQGALVIQDIRSYVNIKSKISKKSYFNASVKATLYLVEGHKGPNQSKWWAGVFVKFQNNRDSSWKTTTKLVWQLSVRIHLLKLFHGWFMILSTSMSRHIYKWIDDSKLVFVIKKINKSSHNQHHCKLLQNNVLQHGSKVPELPIARRRKLDQTKGTRMQGAQT